MTPEQLTELRIRLGLSQIDFAAKLGYRPETISRFEKGRKPIPPVVHFACIGLEIGSRAKKAKHPPPGG